MNAPAESPIDLISLVLTLRPRQPEAAPNPLPPWWGRAAHALLLDLVRQVDPPLSESLHDESALRPFTASTLMGRFPDGRFEPQGSYLLRLTALQANLAAILCQAAYPGGALAPGAALELDYIPFEVTAAEWQGVSPWSGQTTYQELGAAYLLAKEPPPRRFQFQLTSPTTFKSGGKHLPMPLPELLFGSLLERWNSFATIGFPDETRRYAAECLAITRFDLETRPTPSKGRGLRVGAVGSIAFTSLNYDRYWMSVLAALAEFGRYAGVGAGASQGLGQCRVVGSME